MRPVLLHGFVPDVPLLHVKVNAGVLVMEGRCWQGYLVHMASARLKAFSQHSSCKHALECCSVFSRPVKHVLNPITESSKGDDVDEWGCSDP